MPESPARPEAQKAAGSLWTIALAALGVVYGDIGTSPLYALRECFNGPHSLPLTEQSVLGVLSLVFWVLIVIISVKYMVYVLSADNRGEGGILALTALTCPQRLRDNKPILLGVGLFGAALLYGDGILTPAISVLSAVEGLKLATPTLGPFVIPITCVILIGLFAMQSVGTARIGRVFGPIILMWFLALAVLGIRGIMDNQDVLKALNPYYAYDLFVHYKTTAFLVLGALFLVVTGGEALYADMGHFGKQPIRMAWFTVALPGLLLNYFGQGALLLTNPAASENPFYLLAPPGFLVPLILLATCSTVIASQALISGVFSLTRQAIQLGFAPRLQIIHTSSHAIGQIYIPQVNYALLLGCLFLVLEFKSSSNLAAAYGISVSTTMVITTLLMFVVTHQLWKWPLWVAAPISLSFLVIDLAFLGANLVKIGQGGWFPLAMGGAVYTLMTTWRRGRQILADRLRAASVSMTEFLKRIEQGHIRRVPGTALFMVGDPDTTPPAMVHNVKHNKVLHEMVLIVTVLTKEVPHVKPQDRLQVQQISESFFRVVAQYGFMDLPNMLDVLEQLREQGIAVRTQELTFFLGRETLIASANPGMAIWREHLFAFMSRNAQRATAFFNIPVDQVIEVGIQVEL